MQNTNATPAPPPAPMELDKQLSLLEALQLDELNLDLKLRLEKEEEEEEEAEESDDAETTPSSETTTLSERQSSITESPRTSICSSNTSHTSARSSPTAPKPPVTKRVRFQESVSCSFFQENLSHLARPPRLLHKRVRPSFWDRMKPLGSIPRRSSAEDLTTTTSSTKRPGLAPKSLSFYTVQQPLRESAGRKYDEAQTIAYFRTKPTTTKGDWGDLLGSNSAR